MTVRLPRTLVGSGKSAGGLRYRDSSAAGSRGAGGASPSRVLGGVCPLARAAARALGLDEVPYDVLLLEVLRREAPKGQPDAEAMLSDFQRDLSVLGRLSRMGAAGRSILEHYYERGVSSCAPLIQSGAWWRAVVLERVTFRRIERLVYETPEEGMVEARV